MFHRWQVLLTALALVLVLPLAVAAQSPLSVEADSLEFSADGQIIQAQGHVFMVYGDITLRAEALICRGKKVQAMGSVTLTSGTDELQADQLELDLETKAWSAKAVHGRLGQFYVRGETIAPGAPGEQILSGAGLTRCNLAVPCYELQAGRITVAGSKVTVERGWLALKGRRLLPLPRLSLDVERIEDWPSLSGGYDERGFFLGGEFALPLTGTTNLVLSGELATADPFSLRTSLVWRPDDRTRLEPWLDYSSADGFGAGFDGSIGLGVLTAKISISHEWAESLQETRLSIAGPAWDWAGGQLSLEGFWARSSAVAEPERMEAGTSLTWSTVNTAGNRAEVSLSLGRAWESGSAAPLLRLHADATRRFAPDWGVGLEFTYDTIGHTWDEGLVSLTRYMHCYYLRLGYDWTKNTVGLSGGLVF